MLGFTKTSAAVVAVAAALGVVSASEIFLTTRCQTALAGIVKDGNATCLNPGGLVSVAATSKDASLIQPIDAWIKGMCATNVPACSGQQLAFVIGNADLALECGTELTELGYSNLSNAQIFPLVQQVYPYLREALCLENTDSNINCATQFLTNLQGVTGTFNDAALGTLIGLLDSGVVPALPKSVDCTDCSKGWFNIVKKNFPNAINSSTQSYVQSTCGDSFVDGQTPSTLHVAGYTVNSAAAIVSIGGAVSALAVLLSGLAFLA